MRTLMICAARLGRPSELWIVGPWRRKTLWLHKLAWQFSGCWFLSVFPMYSLYIVARLKRLKSHNRTLSFYGSWRTVLWSPLFQHNEVQHQKVSQKDLRVKWSEFKERNKSSINIYYFFIVISPVLIDSELFDLLVRQITKLQLLFFCRTVVVILIGYCKFTNEIVFLLFT